jgi:putative ABC transport system permease protein
MFMLIIMLGAGSGLKNGTTSMFGQMATNSVYIWTQNTTMPYKGYPRGRRFNFTNDDIQALNKGFLNWILLLPVINWEDTGAPTR